MTELTLEDIAKEVGVSRSTISRVVNGSPNVRPEVRKHVLEYIHEIGYQPHAAARSLASQHSGMIGLVLPQTVSSFFTDPYFPYLTQGIAYRCNNNDLTLSLFLVENKADEERIYPRIARRGFLDGMFVQSGHSGDTMIEFIRKSSLPIVILGRPFEPEGFNYIDVDNLNAAVTATQHLINLGYRRIAHITGSKHSTVTIDRMAGYKKAMLEAGRTVDEALIAEGDFSESTGYDAMKVLLPQKPDAVFAASDLMATGAMRAISEAGLRVPEDIAMVGFDDVPVASMPHVKLTTIRQPITQMGMKAVEFLTDLIANGTCPPRSIVLDTELIVRESCGAKRIGHSR